MKLGPSAFVFFLVPIVFVLNNAGTNVGLTDSDKCQVLVVGTVHQRHSTDTNYSYQDIFNILSTYNPDVVCVEIRPKEFRREPYVSEMTMATIWGILHGRKVYPIDRWRNDTRHLRDSLTKLPEYTRKAEEVKALEIKDTIVTTFEGKYGTWGDQTQRGYEFWNGKAYNEYTMEDNRLWMEVFGDGPITLYYRTRNDSMMALVLSAISDNPGRKVIVLTGCEHKHYFDRALVHNRKVSVVDFSSILPLRNNPFDPQIKSYFDESDDLPYYEKGYPQDMNEYYRSILAPLIHGADMDFNPAIVPARNIRKAEKVINRWRKDSSSSAVSDITEFELGWLNFLKSDYREAIRYLLPLSRKVASGTVYDAFLQAATHRNLGLCYDCVGQRDSAIVAYTRGEELARATPFSRAINLMFNDYKARPYHPKHR